MSIAQPIPLLDEKKALRQLARQRRAEVSARLGPAAAEDLADCVQAHFRFGPADIVAGYWPLGDEIDPRALLRRLDEGGVGLALPAVARRDRPLIFRSWRPGEPLLPGEFGTWHPAEGAPVVVPTLLLVPLVAFDRAGHRLGYGGGYYDRTLARLRESRHTRAIGLGYAAQEFDQLPAGPHDQRLDGVATETGFFEIRQENDE